ncbi:MAG: ABC transporter permease subunit [bacterium]|nr:ABC transporter permease subunit [bacterium]
MPDPEKISPKALLSGIGVIFSRELSAYFDAPIAYIYATVFLVLSCSTFMNAFFLNSTLDMAPYFDLLPYLLIPFIPAITMRVWAEERAQFTFELLMTLPMHSFQIVLGKYIASFVFYLIVLLGSLPIVLMLSWLGEPDFGLLFSSYLGALYLGGFFLAFGLFVSGLTGDQIVAFVLSIMLGFIFVLSGHEKVVEVLDGLTPTWELGTFLYESLSVMPHYEAFCRGIISPSSILYFMLMAIFFIWMNDISLKRSKY